MTNQDQTDAMAAILGKMNAATNEMTDDREESTLTQNSESSNSETAAMHDVLARLQEATGVFSETIVSESKKNPDLGVAINTQRTDNGVSVSRYDIRTEKKPMQEGIKKTFYYIVDNRTGEMVHEDLGLFETAMGVVKHMLFTEDERKVKRILDLDQEYVGAMMEIYSHKQRLARLDESEVQYDVITAKYSNAKTKLGAAKLKLLKAL